jgi:hypothetical protein
VVGADYAAQRTLDAQEYAQRELTRLERLVERGIEVPQGRMDELRQIAKGPGFWGRMAEAAAPIFQVLEVIDRPRQLLVAGATDLGLHLRQEIRGDDKGGAGLIDAGTYWDIITGDKEAIIKNTGTALAGKDGNFGFSSVLSRGGWETTDNWANKSARFITSLAGDVALDPATYVTFGAAGVAKAQRARFLLKAVDDVDEPLRASLKASRDGVDEATQAAARQGLEEGRGELGQVAYRRGVERTAEINDDILDQITRAIDEGIDEDGILAKYQIDDILEEIEAGRGTILGESVRKDLALKQRLDDGLGITIWDDAADKATMEVTDRLFNDAAGALAAKDWLDPALKMVADGTGSAVLKGGMKLQVPIVSQRTGRLLATVPGTRGAGRKLSNAIFGHSSEYAKAGRIKNNSGIRGWIEDALAPNLYQRWSQATMKFADDGLWRSAMRGGGDVPARQLVKMRDKGTDLVAKIADQSGARVVAQSAIEFGQAASKASIADDDLEKLMRGIGRILETNPRASLDEIANDLRTYVADAGGSLADVPREVVESAYKYAADYRSYTTYLHQAAKDAGLPVGDGLDNYVPHYLTEEANELFDHMIDRGFLPTGDDPGSQILRALLNARRAAKLTEATVVGEAQSATQRTIGRTVMRGTGDVDIPFAIGDSVMHNKAGFGAAELSADELNVMIRESLEAVAEEHPGFKLPKPHGRRKDSPFSVYNENPFETLQAYGHDLQMAIAERTMLNMLDDAGLIADAVTHTNQQQLAQDIVRNLGVYGEDVMRRAEAQTAKMLDDQVELIRGIREGALDEEMVEVTIGASTVQIPKSALDANRKLQKELAGLKTQSARQAEVEARATAFYLDTYNAQIKNGTEPAVAQSLAQAATMREVRGILKESRKEIKRKARRTIQTHMDARYAHHEDRVKSADAAYRAEVERIQKMTELEHQQLAKVSKQIEALDDTVLRDEVLPISNSEAMFQVNEGMRMQAVSDVRDIAENMRNLGEMDSALMIDTLADFMEGAGRTGDMEALGSNVREIVETVHNQYRQRVAWLDAINPQAVAQADTYMDQAFFYEGNILDPGDWGAERYADARYVFHGTSRPNMSQVAQSRVWGGGGLTANPVRANAYAEAQWVIVWDLDSMPDRVAESIRLGQDVESRNQFANLAEGQGMPQPVAILPASAMREAAVRHGGTDQMMSGVARNMGSEEVFRVFDLPITNAIQGRNVQRQFYETMDRLVEDTTYAGSNQFDDDIEEIFNQTRIARRGDAEALVEEFKVRVKERAVEVREWSQKGSPDDFKGKPLDHRTDTARQGVLATWYDNWHGQAVRGRPTRSVGEPTAAPWVDAVTDEGGNQGWEVLYAGLRDERMQNFHARFDDTWSFEDFNDMVDDFFQTEFMAAAGGEMSPTMRDMYEATQRSLMGRGLADEFPVWLVEQNDHGVARMSLVPIEGAEPWMVTKQDIVMDWGAFYPQQLDVLDDVARSQRHHIMVEPSKLRMVTDPEVQITSGMPPKSTLQRMLPENLTYNKMLSIFGDAELADEAYNDLLTRLNLIGPPSPELFDEVAAMHATSAPWFAVATRSTTGERVGILSQIERIYDNPRVYGDMFEAPDIRRWYAEQVFDTYGKEVTFVQVALKDGQQVTPGTAGAVTVTVPAFKTVTEEPVMTLSQQQLQAELRHLGVTATEARMHANRYARYQSMSPEQLRRLPEEQAQNIADSVELFLEADAGLYNTIMGVTGDATRALDEAMAIADEVAALKSGRPDPTDYLGNPTGRIDEVATVDSVGAAIDQLRFVTPGQTLGFTISARTGANATRGVSVGTGLGEIRYASPEGLTEETAQALRRDVADWVEVNGDDLSRPGAHIGGWYDEEAGEFVLEISAVIDSAQRAKNAGIELDQISVFDLRSGAEINVPTKLSRLKGELASAQTQSRAQSILHEADRAIKGHDLAVAESILRNRSNAAILRDELGKIEYDNLVDMIETERFLAKNVVPEAEALRAARQLRKQLSNPVTAKHAAKQSLDEALAVSETTAQQELKEIMETQARISELLEGLLGVGLDENRRLLDPSLYPRVEGSAVLEESAQTLARVAEAEALAKRLGWDEVAEALEVTRKEMPQDVMARAGRKNEQVFSVFGVEGTATSFKTATTDVAHFVEQAVSRWQTLSTPAGMEMFEKQLGWIARAWKASATVQRPNFHVRNFIGGVFNGMIADVGIEDYLWTQHKGIKLRQLQAQGASLEDMAKAFGDDWEVVDAARRAGIFGEGFAAGDLTMEIPRGRGGRGRYLNPGSGDFIPTHVGGMAMKGVEDFLRLATFKRWYSELGGEGARDMVNMVHFDYTNLSKLDMKIKKWIPFWVWTKNNIPLQMRALVEKPRVAARYTHIMNNVNENFGDENSWEKSRYASPFAADLGMQVGDDQNWSRLFFDPDLPIKDLEIIQNPLDIESWTNGIANVLGPHVTSPMTIGEQNEWGTTNAPFLWSSALKVVDLVSPYDADVSSDGDVQVGYGYRNVMNTLFPALNEYASIAGVQTDPQQRARLGHGDDPGLGDRLRGVGLHLARGVGVQAATPNDQRVAAYSASQKVRDIMDDLYLKGVIPEEVLEADPEVLDILAAMGIFD